MNTANNGSNKFEKKEILIWCKTLPFDCSVITILNISYSTAFLKGCDPLI